jgi:hypothetical protein
MYPHLSYDKLSPRRKLIANKEVREAGSSLETDNQPNSISNTFMKPDTFMTSNHLFQHTSNLHIFIVMRILILSSCILSGPSWDVCAFQIPQKSLCVRFLFSPHVPRVPQLWSLLISSPWQYSANSRKHEAPQCVILYKKFHFLPPGQHICLIKFLSVAISSTKFWNWREILRVK